MRGLLDTSVFIADEQSRPLASERLPDEAAISVVTLAELCATWAQHERDPVRAADAWSEAGESMVVLGAVRVRGVLWTS